MEPTDRRGLLGAGAAAALGGFGVASATPAAAREIDPDLPDHCAQLLGVLSRHVAAFGPHEVLAIVQRELRRITAHRKIATGQLRRNIMRVESRWTTHAGFLANDTGQWRDRANWTETALQLAEAADDGDVAALARMRQAAWAVESRDGQRVVALTEAALRATGTSDGTRARVHLRAALGHAITGDVVACQRHLDAASRLAEPAWYGATSTRLRAYEAHCWLLMRRPQRAVPLYEAALREWPRDQMRDGGLHQARLALACAATGEMDRARAEGRKALAIARSTRSNIAKRELRRLGEVLRAA